MKVYCLRSCNGDDFAIGLYSSLENAITVLKTIFAELTLDGWDSKELYNWYYIREIKVDVEPTECLDFCNMGTKILITEQLLA